MKLVLSLALISLLSRGYSAEIKLAWNPSDTPGVTNYILYGSTNTLTLSNFNVRTNVGTNLVVAISTLTSRQWQFGVTAQKDLIESDMSNILPIEVPLPPKVLRIIIP